MLKKTEIANKSPHLSSKSSNREVSFHFDEKLSTPSVITTENERTKLTKFQSSPTFSNEQKKVDPTLINPKISKSLFPLCGMTENLPNFSRTKKARSVKPITD